MSNIIRIIASDWKRLATNVVAVVVVMGLSALPCLYAWFNILSNWDPYGEEATSNLSVAVVSVDEGTELAGVELNVGDKIVTNLKENKSIGWVFPETEYDAVNAVTSGEVYACLVVDKDFTANLISFLDGDLKHPVIDYYENDKINAIAPKITGKVKTTVQTSVNQAFIGTIAEVLASASEKVVSYSEDGKLTSISLQKLESLKSDLNTYVLIVDSYLALMDSTDDVMEAAEAVTDEVESLLVSARSMANSAESAADAAVIATNGMLDAASAGIDSAESSLKSLETTLGTIADKIKQYEGMGTVTAVSIKESVASQESTFNETYYFMEDTNGDGIKEYHITDSSSRGYDASNSHLEDENYDMSKRVISQDMTNQLDPGDYGKIDKVSADYRKLYQDSEQLEKAANEVSADLTTIMSAVEKDLQVCQQDLSSLNETLSTKVTPQVKTTMSAVQASVSQIQQILNFNSASLTAVSKALNSYPDVVGLGRESLVKSREDAVSMMDMLSELIEDVENLDKNERYNKLMELIKKDPGFIADFVSCPVEISQEPLYPIDTNGSASAPFYIVLSIWVGSLILSTILKTPVKDQSGLKNVKNWQCFFGRYATTFVIAQLQTMLTVLGALLYIGIQCKHPFLLWLCCSWTATVFSLLLYSFSYSFGNVGEALSVILMVIQVAGSGGTFPIEVLPKPFQLLYEYMPFAYSMNAARECIAGMYELDYWKYMAALLVYVAVAVFIGLVLYFPMKRLNHLIEKSKESSGILI
ncbi:MAG: YhgE/Pip domain-containing protein [Pseudobutyrivibrio sp.]|nr:YhgE/Pip domain-containing protein [Pseudobutyrivibrio sp.]